MVKKSRSYLSQMAHARLRNKYAKKNKPLSAYHGACLDMQSRLGRILTISEKKRLFKYFVG